ncbi:MAG: hypothetical protein JXO44_06715 [Clostridia bacterium]|nr:hypothetical protein [Clostridia bacterium]
MLTEERMQFVGLALLFIGFFAAVMSQQRYTYDDKESEESKKKRRMIFKRGMILALLGMVITCMNLVD